MKMLSAFLALIFSGCATARYHVITDAKDAWIEKHVTGEISDDTIYYCRGNPSSSADGKAAPLCYEARRFRTNDYQ